jgi:hypothetical protein
VPQHNLFAVALLLGAGLLAGPGRVHGQQGPRAPAPPSAWATTATDKTAPGPHESQGSLAVIASSRPQAAPPVVPPVVPAQAFDDGWTSSGSNRPPSPPSGEVPSSGLQPVSFYPSLPALGSSPNDTRPDLRPGPGPAPSAGPGAQISITVIGHNTIDQADGLPFEIVVRNAGEVTLAGVRVEQQLPAGSRILAVEPPANVQGDRLIWELGNLEVRGQQRLKVDIHPGGQSEVLLSPTATFTSAFGLRTHLLQPPFGVLQQGPETAVCGSAVVFRILVANHLQRALQHATIRARLSAGLQHPQGELIEADLGTLAAGETRTLELEAVATQPGTQINDVTAQAIDGQENRVARSRLSVQVNEPSLVLKMEAPRQSDVNSDLDLRIHVHNLGRSPARAVRLVFNYPKGMDILGSSNEARIDPATGSVTWELETLEMGQTQVITLKTRPRQPGEWALRAMAMSQGLAEASTMQTVHIESPGEVRQPATAARTEVGWR